MKKFTTTQDRKTALGRLSVVLLWCSFCKWLRGRDLNPRPLGYEPNELPDCSTPRNSLNQFEASV